MRHWAAGMSAESRHSVQARRGGAIGPDNLFEDVSAGQAIGEGLVAQADTMEDHVIRQGKEVFRNDVVAAVDQGPRTRTLDQGDPRPWARPQFDARVLPRARHDLDDVIGKCLADIDIVNGFHGPNQVFRERDRAAIKNVELGPGDGAAVLAANTQSGVAPAGFPFPRQYADTPVGGRA